MAGTSASEVRWGFVSETTPGTTPTTPGFDVSAFDEVTMLAPPNVTENRQNFAGRRRSGISRSGYAVTGSATGGLIYGVYDDLWASLLQGAWSSNVLVDTVTGTSAFTVEQTVPAGSGGTATYMRYRGVEATGGTIALNAGQNATVTMEFLGLGADAATTTAISGATYTAPSNTTVLGSGSDVGFFTIGALTVSCMQSATITWTMADKEAQPRVGSDDYCGIRRGAATPTITAALFVEAFLPIYNAARTGGDIALTIPLGVSTGEKYEIVFPRVQISAADVTPSGADLFQNITILPMYSSSDGHLVEITRAVT